MISQSWPCLAYRFHLILWRNCGGGSGLFGCIFILLGHLLGDRQRERLIRFAGGFGLPSLELRGVGELWKPRLPLAESLVCGFLCRRRRLAAKPALAPVPPGPPRTVAFAP